MKTILVDAIGAFVVKGHGVYEDMQTLLDTFPNRKIILTGANDEQFKEFGLDNMPYEVFTLKHDPDKTDLTYFTTMLDHFGLTKEEVIYFEHANEAVKCAQSVGIVSFYYEEAIQDLGALKKFLGENL